MHTNAIQCAMVVRMVNALCRIHANALMVINGIPTKISAFQFVQRIARMENVSARTIVPVMKTIILTTHLTHVHRVAKVVVYLVLASLQINALVLLTIDQRPDRSMNVNQFVNRIVSMANVFRQISVYVMRATETSRHMNVNHTASPNVKMPLVMARINVLVSLAIDSKTDHSLNVNQSVNLIVRTVIVFRQTSAYAKVVTRISQPLQVFSVNRYVNHNVKMAIASVQTNVNVEMVIKLRMKR